jgi:hypothetical protein
MTRLALRLAVALGALLWAVTLALTTPAASAAEQASMNQPPTPASTLTTDELHLWVQELREAALVLLACGLLAAVRRYGPALPTLIGTGALLAVDLYADRTHVHGGGAATGLLVLAAVVCGLVVLTTRALGRPGRPNLARIAVVAGYCAPAMYVHAEWPADARFVPLGLTAGSAAVGAGLAGLAGLCASAARPVPLQGFRLFLAVAVPALLVGAGGAATGFGGSYSQYATAVGAPLAVAMAAVARWRTTARPWRTALWWLLSGLLAAVAALPLVFIALTPASLIGSWLMRGAGYGFPADGLPYLPGALLVGLALAALLARTPHPVEPAVTSTESERTVDPSSASPSRPGGTTL